MLGSGRIDVRRARVLADGTAHLTDEAGRRVVAEIADRASELTTGQLRALLRKLCLVADPEDTKRRLQRAVEDRRVVLEANPAGSANLLLLDLPPDVAAAARERIDHLARRLPGDGRSMDQRRADVAIDLLTGHTKPLGRGMVDLTVDLRTLLGLAEHPGELGGWGRWSPTSPARSPTAKPTAGGRPPSSTTTATPCGGGAAPPNHIPGPASPGTEPHLRVPRMPPTRPILRPRPHQTPHRRRPHPRKEPGTTVRIPPPGQRRRRLAIPAPTQRRPHLDQPPRPHLHHQRTLAMTTGLRMRLRMADDAAA